jgi:hypothetical protein
MANISRALLAAIGWLKDYFRSNGFIAIAKPARVNDASMFAYFAEHVAVYLRTVRPSLGEECRRLLTVEFHEALMRLLPALCLIGHGGYLNARIIDVADDSIERFLSFVGQHTELSGWPIFPLYIEAVDLWHQATGRAGGPHF